MYQDLFNNLEKDAQDLKERETKIKEIIRERNKNEKQINYDYAYKYRALENIYRKTYNDICNEHQEKIKINSDFYNEKIEQFKKN